MCPLPHPNLVNMPAMTSPVHSLLASRVSSHPTQSLKHGTSSLYGSMDTISWLPSMS